MYKNPYPRLFFDLETVIDPDVVDMLPPVSAPKNIKDPVKIEAAIREKQEEMLANAMLDPDLGAIRCVAFYAGAPDYFLSQSIPLPAINVMYCRDAVDERSALSDFWHAFDKMNGYSVGYNTLNFDWPYIMKRSMYLGVEPTVLPEMARFRSAPTTDLFQILNHWQYGGGKKLKWICQRFGIAIPYPDIDGSMVAGMTQEEVERYAASDVRIVIDLFNKMNGYYFTL